MNRICCFAGHSKLYGIDGLLDDVKELAEELIVKENVKEFWVGNYGSFDRLAAGAIKSLKEKYTHIQLNLVIPYLTGEINENKEIYYENYDNILIADISENTPIKYRIVRCNEYMVQNSDFIICYVEYGWGGASKTLEFAKKQKHIKIFNLSNNAP